MVTFFLFILLWLTLIAWITCSMLEIPLFMRIPYYFGFFPFIKVVKFADGEYAVRRLTIFGYVYLKRYETYWKWIAVKYVDRAKFMHKNDVEKHLKNFENTYKRKSKDKTLKKDYGVPV